MNIKKGGGRLVSVVSWLVAIRVWLMGLAYFRRDQLDEPKLLFMGVIIVIGILAGLLCSRIGLWVLDGFLDDKENNE